jgi:hypothetical protein
VTRRERGTLIASVLVVLGMVLPLTVLALDHWPPLKDLDDDSIAGVGIRVVALEAGG